MSTGYPTDDQVGAMQPTRRPRVVHFAIHPPDDSRVFRRECRTLAEAGYDVTLITRHSRLRRVCDGIYDGVTLKQVEPENTRLKEVTRTVWRLAREVHRTDADLYHFHDPELLLLGLSLRLKGKMVIYDSHENAAEQISHARWISPLLRGILRPMFRMLESFVARRMSAIVAAREDVAQRFAPVNQRVVLVGNYARLADFPMAARVSRDYSKVVNFGGINPGTCTEQVIDALAMLPESVPCKMVLAGLTFSAELLQSLKQKPGWKAVEFLERVKHVDVVDQSRSAAVAIVLYSPEPNHYSIGSNRLFEAMAAGTPVITSNFPEFKKLVNGMQCGMTVDPMKPTEIREALEYLLTHPEEAAEMGRRGQRAFQEVFNWEKERKKLLNLYSELLCSPLPCAAPSSLSA